MEQKLTGPVALVSSAWKLFREQWKILVPIAILPSVANDIGQLISYTHTTVAVIAGGIISIASLVVSIAMAPAFVNALHRMTTEPGATLTINGQYRIGFSFFWSVILVAIINGLAFLGSVFIFVIPAIVIGVYASQYVFALVIDGKKGFSSLTESYSLVKGRWGPVFGRALFIGLVVLIIWLIIAGIGLLLGLIFGVHVSASAPAAVSIGGKIIALVLNLAGGVFVGPLVLIYSYYLYLSLKATRQAEVQTAVFKKWLIAFMCLAIIPILAIFIAVPLIALNVARHKAEDISAAMQAQMQKTQRLMQGASTTLPSQNI